jgi:hypothetical protein
MLVIISDLHLTDGTSGATISAGAFQLLAERIADLALRASWRADGGYRPLDRIDLLLLGDVLDVIRSTRWLTGAARPWDDPHAPETVAMITDITRDILRHNAESFAALRSLAQEGAIRVPSADPSRGPETSAEGRPVPVHIHYMVGNHDWFFHVRGGHYDALRQMVCRHLGLSNPHDQPFPHDPRESDELLEVLRRHKTFARHGDIYDPFNFEGDRDASSLGDAVVIELLGRFSARVESELADELPDAALLGLREIDNIRPLVMAPVWIEGLLERTCPYPAMRNQVKKVWDELADEFLELPMVRRRDGWNPADAVDGLQRALKFSRRAPVGWASWIAGWLSELRGGGLYRRALAERDFRNRRAKHIVYGHTHQAESVPLDASFGEGYVLNQVYFNSGTWRRVHRPTQLAPGEHEFIPSEAMTYLAFFQGDERDGRPYESWTGMLATQPPQRARHRVDSGTSAYAAGQSIPASGVPGGGPHFAVSPAKSRVVPTRRVG